LKHLRKYSTEEPEKMQGLWRNLIDGCSLSFAEIYSTYFDVLYSYGYQIYPDKSTVKDAIQDLFVDLWRSRAKLSPTTSVRFYLYRSLRRRLHRVSQNAITASENADHLTWEASAESQTIQWETEEMNRTRLRFHINALPERQKEALSLRFYEEFSWEEIGEMLNVNAQSARNLVQRAVQNLKEILLEK
jgi:RNA polymerase sigma factor (sigma-70 family)